MALVWHDLSGNSTINRWIEGGWSVVVTTRYKLLKDTLLSAGWTVVVSGDGTSKSIGTDVSGSFTVNYAWVILQDPGGGRCFGFQRQGDAFHFSVKYIATGGVDTSTGAGNTMSSALTPAEDVTVVSNASYDYDSTYAHCVADNASPYGFYLISSLNNSTANGFSIIFDPLTNANASDTDAAVVYHHKGNLNGFLQNGLMSGAPGSNAGGGLAWKWRGAGSAAWTGCKTLPWAYATGGWDESQFLFPYDSGVDMTRGKELVAPLWWGDTNYIKGQSTMCIWRGAGKANGMNLTVAAARDYIVWGPLALRWPNGEKAFV